MCAIGILANILDWGTYQQRVCPGTNEPDIDLYHGRDINAIADDVRESYRYTRGISFYLLTWLFSTHNFTRMVADADIQNMASIQPVSCPYGTLFLENFGRILHTIKVYAIDSIIPDHLWCAETVHQQILSLIKRETGLTALYTSEFEESDLSLSWNLWDLHVAKDPSKAYDGMCDLTFLSSVQFLIILLQHLHLTLLKGGQLHSIESILTWDKTLIALIHQMKRHFLQVAMEKNHRETPVNIKIARSPEVEERKRFQ